MEVTTPKTWPEWRERLKSAGILLLGFARNPVAGMRILPNWDWPFLLVCQAIAAATCGTLSGVMAKSFGGIITGAVMLPISNAFASLVISGFFYYTFQFVFNQPSDFKRIYTHIVFAQLPALILVAFAPLVAFIPPLTLLGPAAAGFLLFVGFVDNLGIEPQRLKKLLLGMFAVLAVFWILNQISNRNSTTAFKNRATPESLDILEKELRENK